MQKKAIALAVVGLMSGAAFAQSNGANIDAGQNAQFHTAGPAGTLLINENPVSGDPVTTTPNVYVPGATSPTEEVRYQVTNTSTTTSTQPAPNSGVEVKTNGDVVLHQSAVNTVVTRYDTATKVTINTDNSSPQFGLPKGPSTTVYGIYTPAAGEGQTATFVEYADPVATSTPGVRSGGNLTVEGVTTTNGIDNTGNINTVSLTDGTVKLENGELLNKAGHGLKITDNGTILSGGQSGETPRTAVLTLNDGDAINADGSHGTTLTIAGSAQDRPAATVLQVISADNGSNVSTTLGTNAAGSTTTVQAGSNKVEVSATNGTTVKGNLTATANAYLGNGAFTVTAAGGEGASPAVISANGNRVQNVGNAVSSTDAANWGQVQDVRKEARRGIAGAAALAGLPALEAGKQYNFGVGFGNYKGESALSLGGHARINADTTAKFGVGFTGSDATVSAGVGWSF